jgi:hypothetical protein
MRAVESSNVDDTKSNVFGNCVLLKKKLLKTMAEAMKQTVAMMLKGIER